MKDTFSITFNGETRKLKMTMGLLHELSSVVGHVELLGEIGYNPEIRADLLVALLSPRDEDGEIPEGQALKIKKLEAKPDAIRELISWATEHVSDFLLNTLMDSKKILEKKREELGMLMPTSPGSEG